MLKLLCSREKRKHRNEDVMSSKRSEVPSFAPCALTCTGVCMVAMGWSMEVKAEMADMRTSSLTSTLPCTRVCVRGEGGTVM